MYTPGVNHPAHYRQKRDKSRFTSDSYQSTILSAGPTKILLILSLWSVSFVEATMLNNSSIVSDQIEHSQAKMHLDGPIFKG